MQRQHKHGIHIFRRDLRLVDNLALMELARHVDVIYPVFILTSEQLLNNPLYNPPTVDFLDKLLVDLHKLSGNTLTLIWDENNIADLISKLVTAVQPTWVSYMQDYTPYSTQRDATISKILEGLGVDNIVAEDAMLVPIAANIATGSGNKYQKFTPYYRAALQHTPRMPDTNTDVSGKLRRLPAGTIPTFKSLRDFLEQHGAPELDPPDLYHPARAKALQLLQKVAAGGFRDYGKTRDNPSQDTTRMSAYLKYGTISVREAYAAIQRRDNEPLLRQLYWRDFYYYIAYHNPNVLGKFTGGDTRNFNGKTYKWNVGGQANTWLARWKTGTTGVPIVDAGMRQLNTIGWMHNRLRMITSSFLIKDLGINWEEGERYFAQRLVDYDPAQNNGGWQWSSGTGVDSQPYHRVFNPWIQSETHDPECKYIYRWVPELKGVPPHAVHNWHSEHEHYRLPAGGQGAVDYPEPIVDHAVQKELYLAKFRTGK